MENYITNELIESTYLFCAKRISDSEAAKVLSQDILLTAIQNINAGKSFVSFNSWYWKMAHNKYADLVEARRKKRELPLDEAYDICDMSVQPLDAMISREQRSKLNYSLSRLAEIYREIIIRYYLKEQPIKQISDELDIPVGTVKWRLFDAKTQLRERMENMNNTGRTAYALSKTNYECSYNSNFAVKVINSTKICPQVMVICRSEAKTLNDISDELGVAPVFMEEFLNNMKNAGLVRMPTKDKYIANHCVIPESAYNKAQKYAADVFLDSGYAERIHKALINVKNDIMALDFYGNDFDWSYLLWQFYKVAGFHIAGIGARRYAEKFGGRYPEEAEREYYLTVRYTLPDEEFTPLPVRIKKIDDMCVNFREEGSAYANDCRTEPSDIEGPYMSSRDYWVNESNVGLIYALADDPKKELTEKEEEQAAFLIECGILKKQDSGLIVMIPIYTREQHDSKYNIIHDAVKDIAIEYADEVTVGIEKILLPYIRKDLMSVFIHCDMWQFLFATTMLYYYGWDNTLDTPEDMERSTTGLYLIRNYQFTGRPSDQDA